ncbi:MAG: hypothetical protein GY841_16045 [FCB group bacterium]|nr:hypothetical protein [FCB group bacterium]
MGIFARIIDGLGSGKQAHVNNENALLVTQFTCPPLLPQKNKIYRQYLTDDGTSDGDEDMLVDGSTTNVDFWVQADNDNDRYITAVNFEISDDGSKLKFFGATNILTNGCQFFYERPDDTVYLHEELKTSWHFMRMGMVMLSPLVDIKPAKDINAKVDAFCCVMNFTQIMPPYGLKLDAGSKQKLTLRVCDDLTAANMPDTFDAIAYGFDRFE